MTKSELTQAQEEIIYHKYISLEIKTLWDSYYMKKDNDE